MTVPSGRRNWIRAAPSVSCAGSSGTVYFFVPDVLALAASRLSSIAICTISSSVRLSSTGRFVGLPSSLIPAPTLFQILEAQIAVSPFFCSKSVSFHQYFARPLCLSTSDVQGGGSPSTTQKTEYPESRSNSISAANRKWVMTSGLCIVELRFQNRPLILRMANQCSLRLQINPSMLVISTKSPTPCCHHCWCHFCTCCCWHCCGQIHHFSIFGPRGSIRN
mmetsp:Transcript_1128/g.2840  ORF Transcript_1128/g.2840 Transcript_1128/m.2840 type:complete len:221 (+) Transcript_1128:2320-2982(+)